MIAKTTGFWIYPCQVDSYKKDLGNLSSVLNRAKVVFWESVMIIEAKIIKQKYNIEFHLRVAFGLCSDVSARIPS
ncbi:hypothetical protein CPT76_35575 [Paenibacillus sp. AR247]|nr:hypothetical protein CPT76_35575 [Paenibacillus sp. AR247]